MFYLHSQLNIQSLDVRRNIASTMYRVHHGLVPDSMLRMFVKTDMIHLRFTRNTLNHNVCIPTVNLEMSKNIIRYRGVKIWENIPIEAKTSLPLSIFT